MTTQAESIAMDIDSDHSSSSAKSDTSQVSFTNEYDSLPSSGPTSHAHIIDLGEYAEVVKEDGMVKLQDAIVTTLFCVSPDTLKSFLSPTVKTFKAKFGKKDMQLVVWRKGLEVFVSGHPLYIHPGLTAFRRWVPTRTTPASRYIDSSM
jgi:hypothetical protein